MKLNFVHDIQIAYRSLLDSFSRPGTITSIDKQASKVDIETGCLPSTTVLMLMLLDTEVTFKVVSERERWITKTINQLTYAKAAEAKDADFIFVMNDATTGNLENAIHEAKTGNLINPHEAATLVIEADSVTTGESLVLSGPGIQKESGVSISLKGDWQEIRAEKNVEFPLGIDLIFTDSKSDLLCLPRTTKILQQVVR
jgi:alpha-D-ribose 1-methylphosphonate 5-triphosphate synthase subunit PhnH